MNLTHAITSDQGIKFSCKIDNYYSSQFLE